MKNSQITTIVNKIFLQPKTVVIKRWKIHFINEKTQVTTIVNKRLTFETQNGCYLAMENQKN